MSFVVGMGSSLLRALLVAAIAVLVAQPICTLLQRHRPRSVRGLGGCFRRLQQPTATALLVVTWLTPALLVGYAYANWDFTLQLVRYPLAKEFMYALLLTMKLVPIAVGVLYFAPPPPLSPTARYCRRLVPETSVMARQHVMAAWAFAIRGTMRAKWMAFTAVFLLSFQDFEMASLLGTQSWTVWLFDAQVGGLSLRHSLKAALAPVLLEGIVLGTGLAILLSSRQSPNAARIEMPTRGRLSNVFAWVYMTIAVTCVCLIPANLVRKSLGGFGVLLDQFTIGKELGSSLLLALGATVLALLLSRWCVPGRKVRLAATLALCVPGLFGALVLGLVMLTIFQLPVLAPLYDTPLPLMIALTLLLMPLTVLLRLLLATTEPGPAIHLVHLLRRSRGAKLRQSAANLLWHLRGRMRLCVVMLLFILSYFELVASALLAPTALTPAAMRLYNLMHYGQSAMLSAMVCVMVATPIVLLALLWLSAEARRLGTLGMAHG